MSSTSAQSDVIVIDLEASLLPLLDSIASLAVDPPSLAPAVQLSSFSVPGGLNQSYFWGEGYDKDQPNSFPVHPGYTEARVLIGDGSLKTLDELTSTALQYITRVFNDIQGSSSHSSVELRRSDDLLKWKNERREAGCILPSKGEGIKHAFGQVLKLFGAEDWLEPLVMTGAVWGCGMANMLIGAYDARTLYSNHCTDMVFYYEHSYHKVFPEFEDLIKKEVRDAHATGTPAGAERRAAVEIGMRYIKGKIDLEVKHKAKLGGKMAKLDRRSAQIVFFSESSLMGMSAETIVRRFDPAAVMSDMIARFKVSISRTKL
jgi:hypothetical protein